ncbi:septation protein SepH [Bifidobacterium oedipodis]|uniref:DUF3071 domain-containing protein n=1 Tax=Bifidobacterium oedipodis TaxID=2675322 RepID=A0A7Y0EQ84_9BIFI|nr:septation protein SepH [Bifidobacterium sp. DSM 109957]NMM94439.1 hypothetical protein [Bifidobacterium sp. DSM 109957]
MPQDRPEVARFSRVGETGDLLFCVDGRTFAVTVDDTLERAILEAKQVKSETQPQYQPRQQSSLPISQIQSLIRAGANPAKVAEKYQLSEALVRRFSSAVETEKQYAIEQFLTVPAPKGSRVRTVSELVERTLAAASIGMESVTWKATRRGLEPWRIVAQFTSAGREIHAEWTWNMHDNSVVCLNNTARKLLGEQGLKTDAGSPQGAAAQLPGDSVRSARIERTVSAWSAALPNPHPSPSAPIVPLARHETPHATTTGSMPPIELPTTGSIPVTTAVTDSAHSPAAQAQQDSAAAGAAPGTTSGAESSTNTSEQSASAQSTGTSADDPAKTQQPASKPAKRRSGRSAVPSWDEILFGD